mmetsp:Transcript_2452/g.3762  ORF Transcript_2452/g.3762 Transcript_2452/m.3762 type:complete len:92 (-) Transcript_2452:622-897(-)|eukprot:CAMPEP_0184650658 /NCGR_PEP_ID=MMETSP0308-20130426/8217_1 /TAXON_ID=38269 /ORGANISM="Gloeochaete witrockiana, Strain SAG 46.84" /LENGTH=91 /DNA_ID=CAMNT_0027084359 /DNA_START=123 /DNA_END=398 /DNA_ORIENTATION=-
MSEVRQASSGAASIHATEEVAKKKRGGYELSVFMVNDSQFKETSNFGYNIEKSFSLEQFHPYLEDTSLLVGATEAGNDEGLCIKLKLTKSF